MTRSPAERPRARPAWAQRQRTRAGTSCAVVTCIEPKWIWNADTPKVVPASARISAGSG
ncbi:MAG: hypothetical protein Q8Q85_03840 [Gemmatimonadales bacterium]|nr:hypothetical protein [Gemmatimonadales bacterium]